MVVLGEPNEEQVSNPNLLVECVPTPDQPSCPESTVSPIDREGQLIQRSEDHNVSGTTLRVKQRRKEIASHPTVWF